MRAAVLVLATACGRIGFDPRGGGVADAPHESSLAPWTHLVAYADQTCAALGDAAYCWGANASGQLGNGSTANAPIPTPIALPPGALVDLAQGETHGCAVVAGQLYCFGSTVGTPTPVHIATAANVTAVSAGRDFACIVAGGVWCWGVNGSGQLGLNDTNPRAAPTQLGLPASYTAIRCGDDHACATDGATAKCWGHNDNGTLGDGLTQAQQGSSTLPVAIGASVIGLPLIAGWHACVLSGSDVLCWGRNVEGELGNNNATGDLPTPAQLLTNVTALAVGGGPTDFDATCVVQGHAECWGVGAFGRLGQGVAASSAVPVDVQGLPSAPIALAVGYDHACGLLSDGDIWCWGRGDLGQLGDGQMLSSLAPVRVAKP